MSFQSPVFLFLLPLVLSAYFLTSPRYRWLILLVASYGFYATWNPSFCALLLLSTSVDYFIGRALPQARSVASKRLLLAGSIAVNIGLLIAFKYLAFIAENAGALLGWLGLVDQAILISIALPVGISYYTFQTLSYTIDVYKEKRPPERHFGIFAVYVSFFPQLLAGPIERSTHFLPQLRQIQTWDYERVRSGLFLVLLGLFKKLVIADRIAAFTSFVSNQIEHATPEQLALFGPAMLYGFYCDISGYADIALGVALMFGIRLSPNFNRPLCAASIADFWQRWHMTVTRWFRTYVFLELARRWREAYRPVAVLVLFLLIGTWHGPRWGWVLFGLAHGVAMVLVSATRSYRARLRHWLARTLYRNRFSPHSEIPGGARYALNLIFTLSFVAATGVLIGTHAVSDAIRVYSRMLDVSIAGFSPLDLATGTPLGRHDVILIVAAVLALESFQWIQARTPRELELRRLSVVTRVGVAHALIVSVLAFGWLGSRSFVYFDY